MAGGYANFGPIAVCAAAPPPSVCTIADAMARPPPPPCEGRKWDGAMIGRFYWLAQMMRWMKTISLIAKLRSS